MSFYCHFSQREETNNQNCGILLKGADNQLHCGYIVFLWCYGLKFGGWAFTFTFLKENKQTIKQNCGILLRGAATRSFFQTKQARTPTAQKNKIFPTNSNNFFIEIHYKRTRFFQQPFHKTFFKPSQEFCLNDIVLKRICSIQTVEAALSTLSIHYQFMAYTHFLSIHQSTNQHIFINQSILMYNTKNDSLDQIYVINSLWEILVGEDNREHRFFVWISWFSRFLCGINRVSELS